MAQQRALAGLVVVVLLAALCALASAQVPTVSQNVSPFAQNGGILTVYGTGFTQRNINQFTYTLFTGTGGMCSTATGCPFFCHYRSMIVNAAGTIAYCEVPYIPDGTLGTSGSNYITLSISNANGATPVPVTVATISAVVTVITPSTSNPVPPFTTGLTITGSGFPSADSLFQQQLGLASSYRLTLTDSVGAPVNLDLLALRSPSGLTTNALNYWNGAPGTAPQGNQALARYTKTQIDIYYLNQASFGGTPTGWAILNNANGLFATLTIAQQFVFGTYGAPPTFTDTVGPVQIGVITQNAAPTLNGVAVVAPFTPSSFISAADPTITVTGANFLQFPFQNANNLVFLNSIRCDPISATPTTLTCAKSFIATLSANIAGGLALNQVQAWLFAGSHQNTPVAGPVTVALVNSAGSPYGPNFKYPLNAATQLPDTTQQPLPSAIEPDDQTIQQDAHTITIHSVAGSFAVSDLPWQYLYSPTIAAFPQPNNVATTVVLQGLLLNPLTQVPCFSIYPDQANPNVQALTYPPFNGAGAPSPPSPVTPQAPPPTDVCTIVAMTKDSITVNIGSVITAPTGQIVQAEVLTTFASIGGGPVTHAFAPIGIIAPAAGVGGDPHFFGFLGEKYEFNGEPGRVYNLLSDDGLQVNAEIGLWHWKRGNETIIRKLAFRTENEHRVLVDAGGNTLASAGFSISVDGAPILPSRTQKTYLGTDGWVRWYPLTPEDKFRLPLWERHQGVALIDMMLSEYKFQILAVEEGKDKSGAWHQQPSRFLDFMTSMLSNERRPHGLFGQSAHLRANQRSAQEFAIEGSGTDYEVSHLFGEDFVFNKFSAKK